MADDRVVQQAFRQILPRFWRKNLLSGSIALKVNRFQIFDTHWRIIHVQNRMAVGADRDQILLRF